MAKFAKYLQTGETVEVLDSRLVNRTFYECKIETQQREVITITRSELLYPTDLELLDELREISNKPAKQARYNKILMILQKYGLHLDELQARGYIIIP